jgi:type 2 lantibiotic biosynthesis protein LanM
MKLSSSLFQCSEWCHAVTLLERLDLLRTEQEIESESEVAERRMQQWRSQCPFTVDTYFAKRLARDGIAEAELRRLLGIPVHALRRHLDIESSWLAELAQAYSQSVSSTMPPLPEGQWSSIIGDFLNIVSPLIQTGCKRLREGISALVKNRSSLPFNPDTIESVLLATLPGHLLWMLSRTLVLELNVARLRETLRGATPEERFESYLEDLRQPDIAIAILREYPVLTRQVMNHIKNWETNSLDFLHHLCLDWHEIQTTFAQATDPGVLVALESGLGDKHRGGRSVCCAIFSSGFQVIYKPRTLAVDAHFQEFLGWLNDRGNQPRFQTMNILSRANYGWMPFISRRTCISLEEVGRFFERQGSYLAVLYALEATDFHHENLIAVGEHPVLLDLEALFHPRVGSIKGMESLSTQWPNDAMDYSVMRVGLLPERIWSKTAAEGIDISGISAADGQLSPDYFLQWENAGTDSMHFTRKRVRMRGGRNRPLLNAAEVDVLNHTDAVVRGFINTYELLLKHRDDLLASDGPLARFTEDEVRVIIRPTRIYAKMLENSYHPDMLRDALDRERLFDRLWVGIEDNPALEKTILAERNDLYNGDIPIFTTHTGSCDLWSSMKVRIPDFFAASAMVGVRRRLERLSKDDLEKQGWFVMASLTTLCAAPSRPRQSICRSTESEVEPSRDNLLAAARAIGDRLEALALHGDRGISWVGLTPRDERYWTLTPLDGGLYSGLSGVALFFAHLGAVSGADRYTSLAQAVLSTLLHRVNDQDSQLKSVGAFSGWGSVIYTLSHLGTLWNEPTLWVEAEAIVKLLPGLIEEDKAFDIIDGAAGCISSLISLYDCAPSNLSLAAAKLCGERLITCAQPMASGVGWVNKSLATPLGGFAHGAAGIAWALLSLSGLTGEERFQSTALSAIAYERSLFSPAGGNWADLRESKTSSEEGKSNRQTFMTAWCHGAPGIGLARILSLRYLDDAAVRSEIDTSIKTTLAQGFGGNHSLCHGDLGNLELLLQANQTFGGPHGHWQAIVDERAAAVLRSIERQGYLCGVPLGVETPGLMTGLAGIGYGLLRLAEPARVPSVLALQPPSRRQPGWSTAEAGTDIR